jgi:hypothetical protein
VSFSAPNNLGVSGVSFCTFLHFLAPGGDVEVGYSESFLLRSSAVFSAPVVQLNGLLVFPNLLTMVVLFTLPRSTPPA